MPLLRALGLKVSFAGLRALDAVSLEIHEAETVGLIGPNGAGKTTLLDCVSGLLVPGAGTVLLGDEDVTGLPPSERARRGMARTFQSVQLCPRLTVEENVMVGAHTRTDHGIVADALRLPSARRAERGSAAAVAGALHLLGLEPLRDVAAAELPFAAWRLLELARALVARPRLLLLDEPTSGLSPAEKERLASVLVDVQRELGASILLVEHDTALVLSLCEYVYVLDAGRLLARGSPAAVRHNPDVITAYLGAAPPPGPAGVAAGVTARGRARRREGARSRPRRNPDARRS